VSAVGVYVVAHGPDWVPTAQVVVDGEPAVVKPNVGVLSLVGGAFALPPGPLLIVTVGAMVSIVMPRVADALLPAASVTVTVNVYAPSVSAVGVNDVVQAAVCVPIEQVVVVGEPPVVNEKVGVVSLVDVPTGGAVMLTVGGAISIVMPRVAEAVLPAASVTVTVKVYAPSASAVGVYEVVHAPDCVPIAHVVVDGDPPVVKVNVGVLSLVTVPTGGAVMETVGATVSTENERVAVPVFPAASVTVTVKV
jgi:hypothetical protein